jgi:urease accessory protein
MSKMTARLALAAALLAAAGTASAHTGHGTLGFFAGLAHPLASDHLLAMVAVGAWAAVASHGAKRALAPLAFVAAMLTGAVLAAAWGNSALALPLVEVSIALSLVLMGAMLVWARRLAPQAGLVLIAAMGALHGIAHGAELPAGSAFVSYAAGFVLTTALLHAVGLWAGTRWAQAPLRRWRLAGTSLAGAGLVLLAGV